MSFAEWARSLRIKTDKGLQPFELFDWQEATADLICGEQPLTRRPITLLSSRQTGKTSLLLALAAYLAQSRMQFTAVIIHRTTADAHLLCRRVKRFINGVPMKTDSLSLLEFANTDSALHFRSSNPAKSDGAEQTGRGLESVDLVIVEEASHTGNLKEVLGVIAPAMTWSNMGIVAFVGTAGSKLSYYYQTLTAAAGGEQPLENLLEGIREGRLEPFQVLDRGTGAVGVVTNWRAIGRFRSEPAFLERIQNEFDLSDSQIDSEYELIFGSGDDAAVFDFALVMAATNGELDSLSEDIDPHGIYYVGIDPAGAGEDFTVCCVIQKLGKQKFRVAALYRKKKGTSEQHLSRIAEMIRLYYPGRTLCESNSLGQLYLENLASVNVGMDISGHHTSQQTKELLVGKLNLALEQHAITFPKGVIPDELLAFRRTGANSKTLEAAPGANDDCVVALALALHAARFGKV